MTDKKLILRAFNTQFEELLSDLSVVLPGDSDIKTGSTFINLLIKTKPSALINIWNNRILSYKDKIEEGSFDYFLSKNYDNDIESHKKSEMLDAIERLRQPMRNLDKENLDKAMKYMQNLTKLTTLI